MFAGCIHPVFASARRQPAAVAERECQSAAVRKKAKKADEKAKIHVGARMVIGRQKAAAGPLLNILHMLPVPLRTASKFCYGLLRTVTFCCVHPVLLRPTRFLIRTVTAVANLLTV